MGYGTFARTVLATNLGRLRFPYKLTFAATYRCNYRCLTCRIWQRRPVNELTLDEIDRFFARSNLFQWIDFTGGEVWLRRDFPEIVESALRHCHNLLLIHFPTNGYLTDTIASGVERVLRARPRRLVVTVSVDGDEALNDAVRGRPGGWRRQIETYRRLHAMKGVSVVLGMTLSALNADAYEQAFAAAKEHCPWLTPRDYHINVAHTSTHYYGNDGADALEFDRRQISQALHRYRLSRGVPRGVIDWVERRYLRAAEAYLESGVTPMRCQALSSSVFIDPWGDVYPCGMYAAKIGSLRQHGYDLSAIWRAAETLTLQRAIWRYECPQCWTPCEANQAILANLAGRRTTRDRQARFERQPGSRRRGAEAVRCEQQRT